jgi:hypothetical protein
MPGDNYGRRACSRCISLIERHGVKLDLFCDADQRLADL